MTACDVRGLDAGAFPITATSAIWAEFGGTLWLAQVNATGGAASATYPSQCAVISKDVSVTIAGDGRSALRAGALGNIPFPRPALSVDGGSLRLGSSVVLVPNPGAPPTSVTRATPVIEPVAFLGANSAPPGGTLALEVVSMPGDLLFLGVSLPGPETSLPFGSAWLDLGAMVTLAFTTQSASGRLSLSLPVPGVSALHGVLLVSQAANSSAVGLRLTNPVFFALH